MRENYPIDIVVPWVDPTDPEWKAEKREWSIHEGKLSVSDDNDNRYRDWDTIKYLFRSIDKFAPWVRKVHFITYGHLPSWMDSSAERLHIVNHKDYLNPDYLPTFSSHAIELSINKISGLAEHFIYFNDDIIITNTVSPEDFFKKGLPCDYAIMRPLISSHRYSVADTSLTNMEIINDHFKKNDVIKKHPLQWFNPVYGVDNFKSICLMPWPKFSGLYGRHLCLSYLKSTFDTVWEKEFEVLDSTSRHKFRTRRDVNQWIMRAWQLMSGQFVPVSPNKLGRYYRLANNNDDLINAIKTQKYRVICANDNGDDEIIDFEKTKQEIIAALEQIMPEKSDFEL